MVGKEGGMEGAREGEGGRGEEEREGRRCLLTNNGPILQLKKVNNYNLGRNMSPIIGRSNGNYIKKNTHE